jgi:GT2 family glycosyltransferase
VEDLATIAPKQHQERPHQDGDERKKGLSPSFQPALMMDIEIGQPLAPITGRNEATGQRYRQATALVRLHGQPIGTLELELPEEGLEASLYCRQIFDELGGAINAHLAQDGLAPVASLDPDGVVCRQSPGCVIARQATNRNGPFISVVVCTRDRPDLLVSCLAGLSALDYPRYEILVVDNAPRTSATADLVKQQSARLRNLRYFREDRPGLSWARNRGLAEAQGTIVAFTDDDAAVDRYWLTALAQGFATSESVGCVTGLTLPAELESQAQAWFEQFGGLCKGRTLVTEIFDMGAHRRSSPLYPFFEGFGAGVNMAFKSDLLRTLGSFDTALGAGTVALAGEDVAAFLVVLASGHSIVYQPTALVRHFHRRDLASLRRQMFGYGSSITSYLMAHILAYPSHLPKLIFAAPSAIRHFLSPGSARAAKMGPDFPRSLNIEEAKGILFGAIAYPISRWKAWRIRRRFGPIRPAESVLPYPS